MVHLCKQKRKNYVFMHIHNSCTRNGKHLNLLINNGTAHKLKILPQTTITILKKCEIGGSETQSEMMVADTWWLFPQ